MTMVEDEITLPGVVGGPGGPAPMVSRRTETELEPEIPGDDEDVST